MSSDQRKSKEAELTQGPIPSVPRQIGPNPSGLCLCGCEEKTNLAPRASLRYGWVKGESMRYLRGHYGRADTVVDVDKLRCVVGGSGKSVEAVLDHNTANSRAYYRILERGRCRYATLDVLACALKMHPDELVKTHVEGGESS